MESLSRPIHSRKLSNASSFSAKNAYDGLFSGHRHNYTGPSPIDVQNYREIFGTSPAVSSIPVLDISTLTEPAGALNLNHRSSTPDYSKIFGGFRGEDVAVSYEELFTRDNARAPSSTSSSSSDSDNFSRQSSDDLKQFNMSYSKISQKSKDGINGTRHVSQLHAIPGFTSFIDDSIPPLMEAKKHESSAVYEELAVNSDASTSAAALKKAIEKAQESIRIAKESVGRKKKGLKSFSSKSFKGGLKFEGKMEDKVKDEVREVFERATSSKKLSSDVGRNHKYSMDSENLFVAKKFIDEINGKLIESTKESSMSVESCNRLKDDTIVSNSTQGKRETIEADMFKESKENKDEVRSSNAHELVKELNRLTVFQKVEEDEKKVHQDEVLEQENIEDEESDDKIQEDKESAQSCDDYLQEKEASLQDNYEEDNEIKEESLDKFSDEEHDEILSCDDDVSEVDMNDNDVEPPQEIGTGFSQNGNEENDDVQSISSYIEEEDEEESNQESLNEKENENEIREKEKEEKRMNDDVADREKEREKDRLAVERAIREARERARERAERAAVEKAVEEIRQRMFADAREKASTEARERAERAAVEKATEEIRQRMMADAKEKAAKASLQAKLRAERAAVERATSEARQRALEKAMSQKNGTSQSALRSKAKLEKDKSIMERAAKALAEKEKRDLLAQKEQAERNRLAENLDADIKRWSNGKEGNLRALLSTLQHILGGESGWQPVTMTEIVARSAVKKAYRKATLCVHPDKLQQRGASIQQKYICEKVFDLLKAAWNKFNSEEK